MLVGRSGTGKTNFLDAIRFFRDYLKAPSDQATLSQGGWSRLICATAPAPTHNAPLEISFAVTFEIPGVDGSFEYNLAFAVQSIQQVRLVSESLLRDGSPLFSQECGKLEGRTKSDAASGAGCSGHWKDQWHPRDQPFLPVPDGGHWLLRLSFGRAEEPEWSDACAAGVCCATNSRFRGAERSRENFLQAFAVISDNLQNLVARSEIIAALRVLNPSVAILELEVPGIKSIVVGQIVADRILTLDLGQQSEGLRRFLAHLIALYQSPPKQLLAFEEPEKGIFPGSRCSLGRRVQGVRKRWSRPGCYHHAQSSVARSFRAGTNSSRRTRSV